MLNLLGRRDGRGGRMCDSISRRSFLRVGGMAAGGLSLAQLLEMEARAGVKRNHKAIINIYLPGGPSHLDMFDLKPDAPSEIRGEFRPIKTNVKGMEICELFPKLAKMGDKFSIIRSIVGSEGRHDGYQCMTGRTVREKGTAPPGGWPSAGAWVSKIQGPVNQAVPPHLSLMYPTGHRLWGQPGGGGYVGQAHAPFTLVNKNPLAKADNLTLKGISLERMQDRKKLLMAVDGFKRDADSSGLMEGLDAYSQQAVGILSSRGLMDALDLSKEDPKVVARYGKNEPKFQRDGAPKMIQNFLLARRLVEAGARMVSLNYSRWDWHGGDGMNFPRSRQEFPKLDQGLAALIQDLHERRLDKDVSVVVWGEFGRTPKINKKNSRDHWPQVSFALMFGGGVKGGRVIGATDKWARHAVERPVTFQEVFATLYKNVGIDVRTATVEDPTGRPHYLVDSGVEAIGELY